MLQVQTAHPAPFLALLLRCHQLQCQHLPALAPAALLRAAAGQQPRQGPLLSPAATRLPTSLQVTRAAPQLGHRLASASGSPQHDTAAPALLSPQTRASGSAAHHQVGRHPTSARRHLTAMQQQPRTAAQQGALPRRHLLLWRTCPQLQLQLQTASSSRTQASHPINRSSSSRSSRWSRQQQHTLMVVMTH